MLAGSVCSTSFKGKMPKTCTLNYNIAPVHVAEGVFHNQSHCLPRLGYSVVLFTLDDMSALINSQP